MSDEEKFLRGNDDARWWMKLMEERLERHGDLASFSGADVRRWMVKVLAAVLALVACIEEFLALDFDDTLGLAGVAARYGITLRSPDNPEES